MFKITTNGIAINVSTVADNHIYPWVGIKINTPGYSLKHAGSECTPNGNGYCLFSADDRHPAPITITGPIGTINIELCLNGRGPLSCQNYTVSRTAPSFAYITNGGNDTVSICPLNVDGSIGSCSITTGNNTFSFGGVGGGSGITINAEHTIAYVTNYHNSTVSICALNNNGSFGTCTVSKGNGTFSLPAGSIAINSRNRLAYIANFGSNVVSICPINPDGTFGNCTTSNGNGTFLTATQVTLNSAATFALVGTNSNVISLCPINNDGSFGQCATSDGNGTFSLTQGVAFNASESYVYIGNYGNNTVSACQINNNGTLGTCSVNVSPTFNFSNGELVCLFMSSPINIGYIPNNGNNTVSLCLVSTSSGTLGTCTISTGGGTFFQPSAVTLV